MNIRKLIIPGAVGIAAFAGVAGASALTSLSASADTVSSSGTTATTAVADTTTAADTSTTPTTRDESQGGHAANGITETLLTGDTLAKATAAAEASQSGATVLRAETDAEGAAYEVHMQKADGTQVTIKLDSSFKVTGTESGHGGTAPSSSSTTN